MNAQRPSFILASASPRRLQLLQQIGVTPDSVVAADIDETPLKTELPPDYALRVALEKALQVEAAHPAAFILSADTVVACGRRILSKAEDEKTATRCLKLLSGRRHRVYTAVCLKIPGGHAIRKKLVMTQVRFNRLSDEGISAYIASGEWQGKAGGYAIQGAAGAFIPWINGSYSSVVGLPLAETSLLLRQAGIKAW